MLQGIEILEIKGALNNQGSTVVPIYKKNVAHEPTMNTCTKIWSSVVGDRRQVN